MSRVALVCFALLCAALLVACSSSSQMETGKVEPPVFTQTSSPAPGFTPSPTETAIPPTATASITPTPGAGSIRTSEKDGMLLVFVPAGEFIMGATVDSAMEVCRMYRNDCQRRWFTDEDPPHRVVLDAYWIDQTIVTNRQYALCVAAGACEEPSSKASQTRSDYYGNPEFDNFPVIWVKWEDAQAYCAWAGRRLPTEAEWEKAASWDPVKQVKYPYPWGNEPNNCGLSNYPDTDTVCVGDTTAVGSYPAGISPYGALDMLGNVWEYVSDWYGDRYYWTLTDGVVNPKGPATGEYHAIRGGEFGANAYIRTTDRDFDEEIGSFLGFRCASDADAGAQ